MPGGVTSGPTTLVICIAALYAGMSAATASVLDAEGMIEAAEKATSGVIWTGGTPILVCITGAIGGSFFSICLELLLAKECIPSSRLALKFFMQPLLAVVFTAPLIHYTKASFTIDTIVAVSFMIGAIGVYALKLILPIIEEKVVPAIGRRAARVIDPQSADEIDVIDKPCPPIRKPPVKKKRR